MKKYTVIITNGVWDDKMELAKDGEWVNSKEDAKSMAEAKLNKHWTVKEVQEAK